MSMVLYNMAPSKIINWKDLAYPIVFLVKGSKVVNTKMGYHMVTWRHNHSVEPNKPVIFNMDGNMDNKSRNYLMVMNVVNNG